MKKATTDLARLLFERLVIAVGHVEHHPRSRLEATQRSSPDPLAAQCLGVGGVKGRRRRGFGRRRKNPHNRAFVPDGVLHLKAQT